MAMPNSAAVRATMARSEPSWARASATVRQIGVPTSTWDCRNSWVTRLPRRSWQRSMKLIRWLGHQIAADRVDQEILLLQAEGERRRRKRHGSPLFPFHATS